MANKGSVLLQGLYVPLTCPFYREGASYVRKLEANVGRYSLGPAAGVVALAPGGEAGALTDAEAEETLQAVGETAAKEKVLLAGIERTSVWAAMRLAEVAERAGFDAVLVAEPAAEGLRLEERVLFLEAVADRSPLPVVLWSRGLAVEVVARLAGHGNVIGMVDAGLDEARLAAVLAATAAVRREVAVTTVFEAVTRRMLRPVAGAAGAGGFVAVEALSGGVAVAAPVAVAPALKTRTKEVGFQVLAAGWASELVPLLAGGAGGAMPALAACAPQGCFEVYAAWKDGDLALAAERAGRLRAAEGLLAVGGVAAVKAGCDFNGYFGGWPRLPRLPMRAEERAAVERALGEIRN